MLFKPQCYKIADVKGKPFIDAAEIEDIIQHTPSPDIKRVRDIISRSLDCQRLSMQETAELMAANSPDTIKEIMSAAKELKRKVYGNRIVLFAPLYIGNNCINNCSYCGFRSSNKLAIRRTLSDSEIVREVEALEDAGHKRLILVYGEHPSYDAEYIAHTVRITYGVKHGNGEIRRVNINAAPFDVEGFRTVKNAGIGTYQIFQETYHPELYKTFHPSGRKSDYSYRLTAFDRAMEAGIDDVGLGVLLGLGDWRFELLALIRHTNHLEACYGVGPHTISFPRIQNASSLNRKTITAVSDDDFIRMVAILRLAVPYTGLILTAREPAKLRDSLIEYGVSQIDAGTHLEIGGYSAATTEQNIHKEQFQLSDERSLCEMTDKLIASGHIPSFCTACYRKGRTGEHFMEFSTKGFIKRFCTPNALLTFAEYLEDYAAPETKLEGWLMINAEVEQIDDDDRRKDIASRLSRIKSGERDLLY